MQKSKSAVSMYCACFALVESCDGKGHKLTVVKIEVCLLTILFYYMLWLTVVKRLNFTMALRLFLKIHFNYK